MAEGTRNVMLKVKDSLCQVCIPCLANEVCRANAFRTFDKGEAPFLDMSLCWGCMDCLPVCPYKAVMRHEY